MEFSIVNEAQRDTLACDVIGTGVSVTCGPAIGLISWAVLLAVTLTSSLRSITLRRS